MMNLKILLKVLKKQTLITIIILFWILIKNGNILDLDA